MRGLLLLLLVACAAQAAVITVTTEADAGAGSLREAMTLANDSPGVDEIVFDPAVVLIAPLTPLPYITDPLFLHGAITIHGRSRAAVFPGLVVAVMAAGTHIEAVSVRDFGAVANVVVLAPAVALMGVTASGSAAAGVALNGANATLTACTLANNTGPGLALGLGSAGVAVTRPTIYGNAGGGAVAASSAVAAQLPPRPAIASNLVGSLAVAVSLPPLSAFSRLTVELRGDTDAAGQGRLLLGSVSLDGPFPDPPAALTVAVSLLTPPNAAVVSVTAWVTFVGAGTALPAPAVPLLRTTDACTLCGCDGVTVDCRARGLTFVPTGIPRGAAVLDLGLNPLLDLAVADWERLAALPALQALDLSSAGLARLDAPPALLASGDAFPLLARLSLADNGLSSAEDVAVVLALAPALSAFDVSGNPLLFTASPSLALLAALPAALSELELARCDLMAVPAGALDRFPALVDLDVSSNHLASLNASVLSPALVHLAYLSVGGQTNVLTGAALATTLNVSGLPALQSLTGVDAARCPEGFFALSGPRCVRCSPGSYKAAGLGSCRLCAAGTSDVDSDARTPCAACLPGTYTGVGSVGICPPCPTGSVDNDSNPSTPCLATTSTTTMTTTITTTVTTTTVTTTMPTSTTTTLTSSSSSSSSSSLSSSTSTSISTTSTTTTTVSTTTATTTVSTTSTTTTATTTATGSTDTITSTPQTSSATTTAVISTTTTNSISSTSSTSSTSSSSNSVVGTTVAVPGPGSSSSSSASSSGGLSSGALAGIIVGSVAGALVLVALVLLLIRRRRKKQNRPLNFDSLAFPGGVTLNSKKGSGGSKARTLRYEDAEQSRHAPREIPRKCIKLGDRIGEGAFGAVHRGTLDETKTRGAERVVTVAIKTLKHSPTDAEVKAFMREAAIMVPLDHPNVVALVGTCTAGEPRLILLEYCQHGSLLTYLKEHQGFQALQPQSKFTIMHDVASGMRYLADNCVVHRDLAARNVLVGLANRDFVCKVSDFGLSRKVPRVNGDYVAVDDVMLPLRWSAPEALAARTFSSASDVWSFAVLCGEVFDDGDQPYRDWNNAQVLANVQAGRGMPCPGNCAIEFYQQLLAPCFAPNPADRPSFKQLADGLRPFALVGGARPARLSEVSGMSNFGALTQHWSAPAGRRPRSAGSDRTGNTTTAGGFAGSALTTLGEDEGDDGDDAGGRRRASDFAPVYLSPEDAAAETAEIGDDSEDPEPPPEAPQSHRNSEHESNYTSVTALALGDHADDDANVQVAESSRGSFSTTAAAAASLAVTPGVHVDDGDDNASHHGDGDPAPPEDDLEHGILRTPASIAQSVQRSPYLQHQTDAAIVELEESDI